jgi:hypothetical protein
LDFVQEIIKIDQQFGSFCFKQNIFAIFTDKLLSRWYKARTKGSTLDMTASMLWIYFALKQNCQT